MLQNGHGKIAIPIVGGFELYTYEDIIRLEGDGNYTNFFLVNKTKVKSSYTMKMYEAQLISNDFMRVHQSHIININHVKRYLHGDGGIVVMADGSEVDVSRSHKEMLIMELVRRYGCASIIDKAINHSR